MPTNGTDDTVKEKFLLLAAKLPKSLPSLAPKVIVPVLQHCAELARLLLAQLA